MKSRSKESRLGLRKRRRGRTRFRVWVLQRWGDPARDGVPCKRVTVLLAPLTHQRYSRRAAELLAEGFNRTMLAERETYWAVVIPGVATGVAARLVAGLEEASRMKKCSMGNKKSPPSACQKSALDGPPPREHF